MRDLPLYVSLSYRNGMQERRAVLAIQDRNSGMTLATIEMDSDQLVDFMSQRQLPVTGKVVDSQLIERIGKIAEIETEDITYQHPLYPGASKNYKEPSGDMMNHAWDRVNDESWDVFDYQRTNFGWRLRLTRWVEYDEKKHLKHSWE